MGRVDNVSVFEDTKELCKKNLKVKNSLENSIAGQLLFLETDDLPKENSQRFEAPSKVVVSKKRSFEAAAGYRGSKVAVHNFASATNPGGGVERGANAQEECLCRCSGLFFCLDVPKMRENFYNAHRKTRNPIHNDDIIYTPAVTVFKTDTKLPELMDEADWYNVDVITCAAPNLREIPNINPNTGDSDRPVGISDNELLAIHEKRLRRILDVAVFEEDDTVILGAFGCGAFMNNPEVVAQAAKNVISDYLYLFKNIEFAVYCTPQDERNFETFESVLRD